MTSLQHCYACVFRGSRDHYQAAVALDEVDRLDVLVTDAYTPDWAMNLFSSSRLGERLARRRAPGISSRDVRMRLKSAVPLQYGIFDGHKVDDGLGRRGAALTTDAALVYSYYWHGFYDHSPRGGGPRVVFQVHPVASQIRRILAKDREVSAIGEALEPEERLSHTSVSERESELLRADGFVATSAFVSRGIHEAAGGDVRVGVAPYGATFPPVALQEQLPRRPPQRGSLSVLYVGQLSYRKGLHWLLAAMRDLEDARGQVTLTVVSRDSPPRWLGRLPSNVTFKSGLTDAEVEIERARHDAFILPSLIEGFGLVYLEALAAGLPIIATENSGAPEIMTHGDNGLLVQPGSKESILEVLDELRSHPETLRDLQHGARTARLRSWSDFRTSLRQTVGGIETAWARESTGGDIEP